MGDSGEGLIDADAKIQERMDELAAERDHRSNRATVNPERSRELESLRLARAQLDQQLTRATHPVHREQLELALKDIDERLAALA